MLIFLPGRYIGWIARHKSDFDSYSPSSDLASISQRSDLLHILSVSEREVLFRRNFGAGKGRSIFVGRLVTVDTGKVTLYYGIGPRPYAASLAVGAFVGLTFGQGSFWVSGGVALLFFAFSLYRQRQHLTKFLNRYQIELSRLLGDGEPS
jgi:hypothetical protein